MACLQVGKRLQSFQGSQSEHVRSVGEITGSDWDG